MAKQDPFWSHVILSLPNGLVAHRSSLQHGATTRSRCCETESFASRLGTPQSPLVYRLGDQGQGTVHSNLELQQVLPARQAAQRHDHPDSEQQNILGKEWFVFWVKSPRKTSMISTAMGKPC